MPCYTVEPSPGAAVARDNRGGRRSGHDPRAQPVPDGEELMRRAQADDVHAFAALYRRYEHRAHAMAAGMSANRERAEESVQDAFLDVWRTRARYDTTRGGIEAWIFALVRNRCIDAYRSSRRGDRLRAPDQHLRRLAARTCLEDDVLRRDEGQRACMTLHALPAPQREVVVLAYLGELTHTEIAERLAVPLGTIKGRMRLGLSKARGEAQRPAVPPLAHVAS